MPGRVAAEFERVLVESRFYVGGLNKRWRSYLVSDAPEQLVLVRANGSPLYSYTGEVWMPDDAAIEIYPRGEWFNMHYLIGRDRAIRSCYTNIALPVERAGERVSYVDIDLDLSVWPDFSYLVHDEEEFLYHCDLWQYPPEVCNKARATLDDLLEKVRQRDALFSEWERYLPLIPPAFVDSTEHGLLLE